MSSERGAPAGVDVESRHAGTLTDRGHRRGVKLFAGWLPVLIAAGVMGVMGTWGLSRGSSLSNDEAATRYAATYLSVHDLARLLRHQDVVHGTYYLFIHVWSRLGLGNSPVSLRVPSVLALMVGVGLIVVLGRRLTGSSAAGLFAGLIAAATPKVAYYAQTARPYALVFAVVVATTLTLVVAVEGDDPARRARGVRWWVLYGACVTVLGYLNLLALLLLAAHGATLLWARVARRIFLYWLIAAAAGAVMVMPLVAVSLRQTGQVSWIQPPTWHSVTILWHSFLAASPPIAVLVLACAVVGFVAWRPKPVVGGGDAGGGPNLTLPVVAAPVVIMPTALLMVASVVHPIFDIRYVIYGESGVALLAGAGLVTLGRLVGRPRLPTWLPGIAFCAVVLLGQLSTQRAHHLPDRNADYGPLVDYVAATSQPNDGVLFVSSFYRKIELAYPAEFRDIQDFALAKTPAEVGNYRGKLRTFSAIRPRLLAHHRVWTIGPSFHRAGRNVPAAGSLAGKQQALLQSRYRLLTHRRFGPVVVDLWQRAR